MDINKDRCRSCKTGNSDATYHSVSDIGYNYLTFKQLFEESIGYPILEHEPQEFCNYCAERLVEWYEYKDLCQRTQEAFLPMISIWLNVEPRELISLQEEETDDAKPEMSIYVEPSRITAGNHSETLPNYSLIKSESSDDSEEHENPKPPFQLTQMSKSRNGTEKVTITFETYIRYYRDEQLPEKRCVKLISVTTPLHTSMRFFRTHLWTEIKIYIIREVLFTTEGEPIWTTAFRPIVKDLSRFVEFSYGPSSYILESITSDHLELWDGKRVTLYIYPYSTSIKTKEQWIQVTNNLFKIKKASESMEQSTSQKAETSDKVSEIAETTRMTSEVSPLTSTNNNMSRQRIATIQKMPMIAIRTKPDVEPEELVSVKEEELEDEKPDMSIFEDPSGITDGINSESNDDSDEYENPDALGKFTFETYIRHYRDEQGPETECAKLISVISPLYTSMRFFQTHLWTQIRKYLIQEVSFTAEGKPFWSWKPHPATKDLSRFVEISCENSSYSLDAIKYSHINLWDGKQVTLYIYPYSTSIKTKEQWIKVTKNLLKLPDPKNQKTSHEARDKVPKITETTKVTPSTSTNNTMSRKKMATIQKMPMIAIKTEPDVQPEELVSVKEEELEDVKPDMSIFEEPPRMTDGNHIEALPIISLINSDSDEHENREITFETYIRYYRDEQGPEKECAKLIPVISPLHTSMRFFHTHLWTQVRSYLIREVSFTAEGEPLWSWKPLPATKDLSRFVEIAWESSSYSLDAIKYSHISLWDEKRVTLYIYPYSTSIKTKEQWIKVTENLFPKTIEPRITEGDNIEALPINSLIKSESNDDSDENPNALQLIEMGIVRNGKVKITFEVYVRSYRDVQKDERSGFELMSITTPLQTSMHFFRTQLWTRTKKHLIREVLFTTEGEPFWSWKPIPATKNLSRFVEIFYENSNFPLDAIKPSHLNLWNEKRVTLYIYPYSTSIKTKEQWIKVTKNLLTCKTQPDPKKQKTWQETEKWDEVPKITETTEVTPSTSTNNTMQKIKDDQKTKRKVIWYKVKNKQLEVVLKRPLTIREPIETQVHSRQHPSLEDHRYTSTSLRSTDEQCCQLEDTDEEDDISERPSKVLKLEQEATEDYGSMDEEYDVLEVKNEVEYIEVEKI